MSTTERSLADPPAEETVVVDDSVDVTPEVTPETTSVADLIAGMRPTRRAVRIHLDGYVVAQMDDFIEQIEAADEDEDVDHLIDAFDRLREDYKRGVRFVFEGRSGEWREDFNERIVAELGLPEPGKRSDREAVQVTVRMLAEQCVEPEGLTHEDLAKIREANPVEVDRMAMAMHQANGGSVAAEDVLDRDFSQRRSGRR